MKPGEIKALRLELGLTQEQFAHRVGVTFVTVNRWEKTEDAVKPSGLALKAIQRLTREEV